MVSVDVKHHVHLQDRLNSPSPSGQSYCCLLPEAEFWEFTKLLNITDEMEAVSSAMHRRHRFNFSKTVKMKPSVKWIFQKRTGGGGWVGCGGGGTHGVGIFPKG